MEHLSILLGWVQSTQPNRIDKCLFLVFLKNLTSPAISNVQANRFWSNVPFGQTDFGQMSFLVKWILVKCPFWSNGFWSNVPFGQMDFGQMSRLVKCPFWSKNFLVKKLFGQMSLLVKKFLVKIFWSNGFWSKNFWSNVTVPSRAE